MEPSTSSASSGLFFGITSASTDVRSDRGASGNCPRIAWLPITMISRSSAMLDAARMTCSSWLLRKEYPPLPRAENAGEGGRVAKPFRFFRCAAQDADGFLDPPGKNRFPLPEGVNVDALPPPAPDVLLPLVGVAGERLLDIMRLAPAGLPGKPRKPRFQFRAQANGEHGAPPM